MDFSQQQLGLVAAFAILAGAVAFAPQSPLSAVTGQTIEYDSNSEFFDGEVLSIIYNGRTSADDIQATFTDSEIASATGQQVEQDVDISVDDINSQAEYDIQDTGEPPLQEVTVVSDAFSESQYADAAQKAKFDAKNNGLDLNGDGTVTVQMPGEDLNYYEAAVVTQPRAFRADLAVDLYYTENSDIGSVSDLSSPDIETSAEWTVDVEGEGSQSATVSNSDIGDGQNTRLGDHVIVQWLGNLDTGETAPEVSDEKVLYDDDNRWRLIQADRYADYTEFLRGEAQRDLKQVADYEERSLTDVEGQLTYGEANEDFNEEVRKAADVYTSSKLASGEFQGDFSNGKLIYDAGRDFAFPSFQVLIEGGDYFTVEKTVAEPEIVSVSKTSVSETGGGTITVTARNDGNAEGSINARIISEDSEFTPTSLSQSRTIDAGERTDFIFNTGFDSSSNEKRVTGDFRIELTNAEGATVERTVQVEGVQRNECQPGVQIVDTRQKDADSQLEDVVLQCGSQGQTKSEVLVCGDDPGESHNAVRKNGEYVCEQQPSDTEICGNGVDDDGDGKVDENCGGSKNCQITLFEAPTGQTIEFTNPLCAVQNAVDNALGSTLGLFDLIVSAVAGLVGFGLASRDLGDFVAPTFDEATRLGESQVRLILGLVALIAVGYLTFTVISNIFVKIALVAAGIAYAYIKSLIPGV